MQTAGAGSFPDWVDGMSVALSPELAAIVEASDIGPDLLAEAARHAAATVQRNASWWKRMGTPDKVIQRQVRGIAKRHHIELPNKAGLQQVINRLSDSSWWRRALRKRFRAVEYAAIQSGAVHTHAGKYVSDKTMSRAKRDKRRIDDLLASLVAVNQTTGEMLPMDEIAAQSLSNPQNRRMAMMARIKGIEDHEKSKGNIALFLTITCPGRMHARHVTGAPNERYDGTGPRQAQAYLNRVWRRAKRKLDHEGVSLSGLRVVEPHHDGCPHWHVLVFVKPEQAQTLIQVMHAYALCDSPNEPGASEHRFKAERIDPARGSAVGYVAKYVSKSIDGEGVGTDDETGAPGKDAAPRIVAWAHAWGIRQFQFFGVPPITPTREMYRIKRLHVRSHGLQAAHQAAQENDYGKWLHVFDEFQLNFKPTYSEHDSTRYVDEKVQRLQGLIARSNDLRLPANLTTRTDEWRIESRKDEAATEEFSPPWTRFNNCAPIDFIEVSEQSIEIELQEIEGEWGVAERKVPRAGHRYQTRGGSIGSRTPRSIATSGKNARTATAKPSQPPERSLS